MPINSKLENPGVSAIKPLSISKSSTNVVVCLPLPNAFEIVFVFKFSFGSILFSKVDLPLPV